MELSGTGPLEPGEGTRAWEPAPTPALTGRAARWGTRHRRALLVTASVTALGAVGVAFHVTRPKPPPPADPPPPSQTVRFAYLGRLPAELPAVAVRFTVTVTVTADSGGPVTVARIGQPYEGLSLTAIPRPPFRVRSGIPRKIEIAMKATACGKVPRNAGLPFLDVTLRNTRAIEAHSFILGERYAHDLSDALQVACGNDFLPSPKPGNTTDGERAVLHVS